VNEELPRANEWGQKLTLRKVEKKRTCKWGDHNPKEGGGGLPEARPVTKGGRNEGTVYNSPKAHPKKLTARGPTAKKEIRPAR